MGLSTYNIYAIYFYNFSIVCCSAFAMVFTLEITTGIESQNAFQRINNMSRGKATGDISPSCQLIRVKFVLK